MPHPDPDRQGTTPSEERILYIIQIITSDGWIDTVSQPTEAEARELLAQFRGVGHEARVTRRTITEEVLDA